MNDGLNVPLPLLLQLPVLVAPVIVPFSAAEAAGQTGFLFLALYVWGGRMITLQRILIGGEKTLVYGDNNSIAIRHNHKGARVQVRTEGWLVLAAQYG